MISVGDVLPPFALKATVSNDPATAFVELTGDSYPGRWLVSFAWPKDVTLVCPTEIAAFG